MLRSKEMEAAAGHRCNTWSCTGSQSGFFSISPEDISQTTQTRGDFLHQGDAKVVGSPEEISLSLTCLLSPGF